MVTSHEIKKQKFKEMWIIDEVNSMDHLGRLIYELKLEVKGLSMFSEGVSGFIDFYVRQITDENMSRFISKYKDITVSNNFDKWIAYESVDGKIKDIAKGNSRWEVLWDVSRIITLEKIKNESLKIA